MGLTKIGNKNIAKKMFGSKEVIKEVLNGITIYTSEEPKSDVVMLVERTIKNVDTQLTSEIIEIAEYAFSGCSNLESITIPSNINTIGAYAFYYCTNLTSITIPSNATGLLSNVFNYCTSLKLVNLYITSSTIKIQTALQSWFIGCPSDCIIHIPSSVTDPESTYGTYWNCYDSNDNNKRLTYYNDL